MAVWRRLRVVTVIAALAAGGATGTTTVAGASTPIDTVTRFAGTDRADTARLIATETGPSGADFQPGVVIVTRQDLFPDGLAGSYLGGILHAPILLTPPTSVAAPTAAAIEALDPHTLIVLGSPVAVSEDVASTLAGARHVLRLGGDDRYETAALVARHGGEVAVHRTAIVASGQNYPDALVAGALSAAEGIPLLLTDPGILPSTTADALLDLGIETVLLAGGPSAVSEGVRTDLEALGLDVQRVFGADRYATAVAFAQYAYSHFGWADGHVNLATGQNFADALALGPHAGLATRGASPILLTPTDDLAASTAGLLASLASCRFPTLDIAGGQAAIASHVVAAAEAALTPDGACPEDTTGPTITITSHTQGQVVSVDDLLLTLAGTVSDTGSGVQGLWVLDQAGQTIGTIGFDGALAPHPWTIDLGPPDGGPIQLEFVAVDRIGNQTSLVLDLELVYPQTSEIVVSPDVVELDLDERADVLGSDPTAGTITFPRDRLPAVVVPGAILTVPPGPGLPYGAFGRVTAIEVDGDVAVVVLSPVPLVDAILQGSVVVNQPLDPSRGTVMPAAGVTTGSTAAGLCDDSAPESPFDHPARTRAVATDLTYEYSFPTVDFVDGPFGDVTIDGSARLSLGLDLALDIDIKKRGVWKLKIPVGAELDSFRLLVSASEDVDLLLDADYTGTLQPAPKDLVTHHVGTITIPIGPVVIPLDVSLVLSVGVDGQIHTRFVTGASQNAWVQVGAAYDNGTWTDLSDAGADVSFDVPAPPSGSADARAFADVSLQLSTPGIGWSETGLRGRATARPYLRFHAATDENPAWALFAGLEAVGSVKIEALSFDVVDKSWDRDVFETRLVDANDLVSLPSGGAPRVPLIIPPTRSRSLAEALFYANVCDASLAVDWYSDVDGHFASGPIGRGSLTPGSHTIRVEVSDDSQLLFWDEMAFDQSNYECPPCTSADYGHFDIVEVAPATVNGARGLAQAMTDQEGLVTDAHFVQTPDAPGNGSHAVADRVPGFPGGDDGVVSVLTTGYAHLADNLNTTGDLGYFIGGSERGDYADDVTVLAVDLEVPPQASCLRFDFRFFSEEYPEYTGSGYTDRFLAQVDRNDWVATANGASAADNAAADGLGAPLGVQSISPMDPLHLMGYGTTFDAATRRLTANAPITPGAHTLYFTLFDHTGGNWDSMVLIDDLRAVEIPAADCTFGATIVP